MSKLTIRVDPKTGKNILPRHIREEGFTGRVEVLVNALTLTFIKPGTSLADVDRSLDLVRQDIALREEREVKGAIEVEDQKEPRRPSEPSHRRGERSTHPVSPELASSAGLYQLCTGKLP